MIKNPISRKDKIGKCTLWTVFNNDLGHRVYHREDGPAILFEDGHSEWYINGKLHRTDGPAVIPYPSGDKRWFLHGKEYNCVEWMMKVFELSKDEQVS